MTASWRWWPESHLPPLLCMVSPHSLHCHGNQRFRSPQVSTVTDLLSFISVARATQLWLIDGILVVLQQRGWRIVSPKNWIFSPSKHVHHAFFILTYSSLVCIQCVHNHNFPCRDTLTHHVFAGTCWQLPTFTTVAVLLFNTDFVVLQLKSHKHLDWHTTDLSFETLKSNQLSSCFILIKTSIISRSVSSINKDYTLCSSPQPHPLHDTTCSLSTMHHC